MNKKFTKLMAALALLTFLAVPLGMRGQTTYEQLTSIANIDENAQYVLGIDGTGFHYSGTSDWGRTALPSAQTPIYYTLTKASDGNSFTAQATIGNITYYLQVPTSNDFSMATSAGTNTDLIIGTTQVSGTNYAVANKTTTARHLRINGTSGLRSYAGTTGSMAFFYKVSGTSMSVSPASIDFGNENTINPNEPYTRTFNVTFANLTESLSVNVGSGLTGVSVSPTSIAANATSPQTVTVYYNPTAEGNLSGNITVSSSEVTTASVSVSGSAYDPANVRYYEKVTEAFSNWSGEYIFTGINSSNYYALTGVSSSSGTATLVTVTENGIKSTPTTDGYKVTIAQTTHGYSLYLAGAGYLYYTGSSNNLYAAQTFTANTCEWTFSFANGVATIANVANNARILQFNYNSGNPRFACYGNSNQTKITLFKYNDPNKVKAPTFSPEGGTCTTAQSVTISSETSGASIYYTTDGSMPTTESTPFTEAFTVSTTTTVKAIAVKSGMTDSDVASTTYTFVTPFTTMQQVYEDAEANTSEHEVYITFNNWVITGTNGSSPSQFYLTDPDNTYGCVIYGSGSGFTRGNTLNGTVRCKLLYFSSGSAYSFAEIKELTTQTAGLTVGTGGSVTPITTTIDALTSEKTGTVVKLENLTYNGTVLTDNNNNIINNSNYIYSATLSTDKTYNITGVFTYAYAQNDTPKRICPRSADDIEEVIITNPTVTVTPSTINAPFAGAEGTLALTYENIEEFISFDYYFCDANGNKLEDTDPDYPGDWIYAEINEPGEEENYTLSYIIDANNGAARTAYVKVFTYDDELEEVYAIVTVNQAQYVVDYATLPFAYDGNGTGTLPAGFTCHDLSTYSSSPKMQFNTTGDWAILKINERPGILTFDIKGNGFSGGTFNVQTSEDGETYTDLKTYTALGNTQSEEFTNLGENVRYIKWIYTNKSSGNVGLGNIALTEYEAPVLVASITVDPDEVNVDATPAAGEDFIEGTLALTYENLTITDWDDFDIQYYDAEGEEAEGPDWIEVLVAGQAPSIGVGYVVSYIMDENTNTEARTAYFKVYAMDDETNLVYSNLVTVNQAAYIPTTNYILATTIENGRHYIITNGSNKAMGAQDGNYRSSVGITIENNATSINSTDVHEIVINGPDAYNHYTIYDAGFLYAAGGNSNNYLKTQEICNEKGLWTITFNSESHAASIVANTSGKNTMRYNPNNDWFSCYGENNTQNDIYLFVKDETTPTYDFYKYIAAASNWSTQSVGWNFIASPLASNYTPAGNMLANNYDLYQLNNTTWENYKEHDGNNSPGFNLVNGRGYLYANSANVTLHFSGAINTFTTEGNANQMTLTTGWNLIGNPYNIPIYINKPYYRMNAAGDAIETTDGITSVAIPACTGVVVNGENGTVTFSTTPAITNSNQGSIQMSVAQQATNRGTASTLDKAIVSFNEGSQLEKFYFMEQNANLYIPQGTEEYAIVSTEAQGEMPVSFRANENGQYTLTVNPEGVEMNYLHLIDNMTGADIDLLQTPSYTFNANVTDYESRFKLVFASNNEDGASTGSASFAFYSNGNWVINNVGEATLQVIDVNGRILSSETVNGSVSTTINATPGVYMLRLINGENVNVQKIVVR